jgi:hypothetical protein
MADVFMYLFLILGALIIAVSYWLLAEALFGRIVRRARDLYATRPIRVIIVGAVTGIPATFLGIALASNGAAASIGIPLLSATVLSGLFGSAGLARLVGEGLPSERDAREPWRAVLRGGSVLSIACVLPFAGWFVLIPVILGSGLGALILALKPTRTKQPTTETIEDGVRA